jgi:hypothetical protein
LAQGFKGLISRAPISASSLRRLLAMPSTGPRGNAPGATLEPPGTVTHQWRFEQLLQAAGFATDSDANAVGAFQYDVFIGCEFQGVRAQCMFLHVGAFLHVGDKSPSEVHRAFAGLWPNQRWRIRRHCCPIAQSMRSAAESAPIAPKRRRGFCSKRRRSPSI